MQHVRLMALASYVAGLLLTASVVVDRPVALALMALAGAACVAIAETSFDTAGGLPRVVVFFVIAVALGLTCGVGRGAAALGPTVDPPIREHGRGLVADAAVATLTGRLGADAQPVEYGVRLVVDVETLETGGRERPTRGRVAVTVGGAYAPQKVAQWTAGRRLRLSTTLRAPQRYQNPGVSDPLRAQAVSGITWLGSTKSALQVQVLGPGSWLDERVAALRARVRRAVQRSVEPAPHAAIVTAILIGDRAGIPPDIQQRLQTAGTYHVVAISGGNIAILVGLLAACWHLLQLRPGLRVALSIACVTAYGLVAVGSPSVWRASVVAIVYLAAQWYDVRPRAFPVLWSAVLALLLWSPLILFDLGFQLTAAATAGILAGAVVLPPLESGSGWWARTFRYVLAAGAATVAAELALLPIATSAFNRVSVAGVALNVAAIPMMTLAQLFGLLAVACEGVAPTLQSLAGAIAANAVGVLLTTARLVDAWPWLSWRVPPPPLAMAGLYYLSWTAWTAGRTRWGTLAHLVLAMACLCTLHIAWAPSWWAAAPALPPQVLDARGQAPPVSLTALFLDVGQGDATMIKFSSGRIWLIDAGGIPGTSTMDVGARVVAPALWAMGVRAIDVLALSHGDPDHAGGAVSVVEDFRPRAIWEGIPVPGHGLLDRIHRAHQASGTHHYRVRGYADQIEGVGVRVLHPEAPDWTRPKVRNDDSLVLQFELGRVRVILPGDIGAGVERELVADGPTGPSLLTVLKVAHHGSAGSTSSEFVEAFKPALAIVSAGRHNRFGHPARAVLDRLRNAEVPVLRTDILGAVAFTTDGDRARAYAWSAGLWRLVWEDR